ncbi:centriolar coiled-coil protein of 110 kDa-like [Hoplias malabaricus]|uniref:centriolar coiled-coil protein of 110 kDa-like n=1 Tax=Hoplias malabaricus TaxID=27720 RepID=UPI0034631C2F
MQSYEEFCLCSLAKLQCERMYINSCLTSGQRMDTSLICFSGRPVLSPVLSEKQRREMAQYRETAARLEAARQATCRKNLLNRVQKVLDNRVNAFTAPEPSKPLNNGGDVLTTIRLVSPIEVLSKNVGEQIERDDESGSEEISLQSLLRRSREYIAKEQCCRGAIVSSKSQSLSDKEKEKVNPVVENDTNVPCYIQYRSPLSPGQPQTQSFKGLIPATDPLLGLDLSACPPPKSFENMEVSLSPRPHRGRPRPVSTGDILFSFNGSPNEPGFTAKGRSPESALPSGIERRLLEVEGVSASRRASHSGSSPLGERGTIICSPETGYDLTETGFRRRCHTLNTNLGPPHWSPIDRSQERVPRFMAGVPQRTPPRRSPPDVSNSSCQIKQQPVTEGDAFIGTILGETRTDEVQWRVQAIGEMQRCLKDEQHALQMSLLMAKQEREQQRMQQGLEDKERQLRDLDEWKAVSECYSYSTSCPISPAEISPGCSTPYIGLHSPISLGPINPSITPPVYLWQLNPGANRCRNRLSQVLSPEQQRALCRLSAIVRGFLTRQLLKTEKVKNLRQTVKDTQEFISSFNKEAPQKKNPLSEQDVSLQERVRAQLRAALFDIHDIFFEMTLEERLALLKQDRELCNERKLREMEKAKSPKEKTSLSAATQKVLDRKKQRVGESPGQTRRIQQKPRSPLTNRGLQRKTPEERMKHSDSLKKQHSLG